MQRYKWECEIVKFYFAQTCLRNMVCAWLHTIIKKLNSKFEVDFEKSITWIFANTLTSKPPYWPCDRRGTTSRGAGGWRCQSALTGLFWDLGVLALPVDPDWTFCDLGGLAWQVGPDNGSRTFRDLGNGAPAKRFSVPDASAKFSWPSLAFHARHLKVVGSSATVQFLKFEKYDVFGTSIFRVLGV